MIFVAAGRVDHEGNPLEELEFSGLFEVYHRGASKAGPRAKVDANPRALPKPRPRPDARAVKLPEARSPAQ